MSLTHDNHARMLDGYTLVYAVLSRRAGGVSVGINLCPDRRCNWQCAYCQVEGLQRGRPQPVDLCLLEQELEHLLHALVRGEGLAALGAPDGARLVDVAFSGDGEPTLSPVFPQAVDVLARVLGRLGLHCLLRPVLITNGSQLHRPEVVAALSRFADLEGEVWFKLDRATQEGFASANRVRLSPQGHLQRARRCALLCPTWIQTCMFSEAGQPPSESEVLAYLDAVGSLPSIRGVRLYGMARPTSNAGSQQVTALPAVWLEQLATRLRARNIPVQVAP